MEEQNKLCFKYFQSSYVLTAEEFQKRVYKLPVAGVAMEQILEEMLREDITKPESSFLQQSLQWLLNSRTELTVTEAYVAAIMSTKCENMERNCDFFPVQKYDGFHIS